MKRILLLLILALFVLGNLSIAQRFDIAQKEKIYKVIQILEEILAILKKQKPPPPSPPPPLPSACDFNHTADVIIFGGSEAGVAAATAIRRINQNSRVIIIEDTDWVGGQLSSQAVTTYDLINNFFQHTGGFIEELSNKIVNYYANQGWPDADSWWRYSPEPYVGQMKIKEILNNLGNIEVYYRHKILDATTSGKRIVSIRTEDHQQKKHCFSGSYFIETSGWGDLLLKLPNSYQTPIGEPNPSDSSVPGCLQPFTYSGTIKRYNNKTEGDIPADISLVGKPVPQTTSVPFNIPNPGRSHQDSAPHSAVEGCLECFLLDSFTGGYRTTPCTTQFCPQEKYTRAFLIGSHNVLIKPNKTGINFGFEDFPLNQSDVIDFNKRKQTVCNAKLKTIQLIWWINNIWPNYWNSNDEPNFPKTWAVDKFEGFATEFNQNENICQYNLTDQNLNSTVNNIQKYLAVEPYLREGVKLKGLFNLSLSNLGGLEAIKQNQGDQLVLKKSFDDQVASAGGAADFHGCLPPNSPKYVNIHMFGIPARSLISQEYENLLAGGLNISQDRFVNASTRLTIFSVQSGEAVGALAGYALRINRLPKDIVNNTILLRKFQKELVELHKNRGSVYGIFYYPDVVIPARPSGTKYFEYIQKARAFNIMVGYEDRLFRPFKPALRIEAAIVIGNLFREMGFDINVGRCDPNNLTFADVPCSNAWWHYVELLYRKGITSGCRVDENGRRYFCPGSELTREQAIILFDRAAKASLEQGQQDEDIRYSFEDVDPNSQLLILKGINNFLIRRGAKLDLIQCNPNRFCPSQPALREFISMLGSLIFEKYLNQQP